MKEEKMDQDKIKELNEDIPEMLKSFERDLMSIGLILILFKVSIKSKTLNEECKYRIKFDIEKHSKIIDNLSSSFNELKEQLK